jgi:hypothetical protein
MKNFYSKHNEITNFREIYAGNIAHGRIFRGSYPVFKIDRERDKMYDKLVYEAGINCVINFADDVNGLERIAGLLPWYSTLLKNGNVIGLDIQFEFDFLDKLEYEVFNCKLRQGFKFLISHEGPYLIHCNAGIDRTGFVAAIIELLFGASIDEVIYDYLLSYGKEFADAMNKELNLITGKIIYDQINAIINNTINDSKNLQSNIEKYFLRDIGLSIDELTMLKMILAK